MSTQHNWQRLEPSGNVRHLPEGPPDDPAEGYHYSGPPIPVEIMLYPLVARRGNGITGRPIVLRTKNPHTGETIHTELNPGMAKWLGIRLIEAGALAEAAEDGLISE